MSKEDIEARLTKIENRLAKIERDQDLVKEALQLIRKTLVLTSSRLENIENWFLKLKDTKPK